MFCHVCVTLEKQEPILSTSAMEEDGTWAEPAVWFALILDFFHSEKWDCLSLLSKIPACVHLTTVWARESTQQPLQMRYWSAKLQETRMGEEFAQKAEQLFTAQIKILPLVWDCSGCMHTLFGPLSLFELFSVSVSGSTSMVVGPEGVLNLPSALTGSLCTSR